MKILHVITGLSTGGAERALFNLLQGGLIDRFDNQVVSLRDEGTIGPRIKDLGVPVHHLGMHNSLPFNGLLKLNRIAARLDPDIVQGWMYHGNLAALVAGRAAKRRAGLIWNIRQTLYDLDLEKRLTRAMIRLNRRFSGSPDILLYNSRLSRTQHEDFGFSRDRGKVIPNGIDIRQYSFSGSTRDRLRAELGLDPDAVLVGHVARFHPMKDHGTFLRAASVLAREHPDVHFLLAGLDVSPQNRLIGSLIPQQSRGRFHLLGERSDIAHLMCAMDIFCLSSSWGEGFPNVIGEAMSVGIPCVVTDVGDSAFVIADTGVLVPVRDEKALAAGIDRLIRLSRAERRALGARARARIESNFALGDIAGRYCALYEDLSRDKE